MKNARKATRPKKSSGKRSGRSTLGVQKTVAKVLAGAAAGAVRAIMPALEDAVGSGEKAAGMKTQRSKDREPAP
jgi:hypothetical protein